MRGPATGLDAGLPPLHLFQALGVEAPQSVRRLFSRRSLKKGVSLLCAGERWSTALAVEAGMLRMYFVGREGREFNKNFHLEGSLVLPITAAMQTQPSLFHIAVVEPSIVWTAPAALVIQELQANAIWPAMQSHLLSHLLTDKLSREHELLTLDGRARYLRFCAQHPELARRVPLNMLATFLGMTDVSLSRIRRSISTD